MERLQWWLLLLSAVMFSMSGCARMAEDWKIWAGHPAHFASGNHLAFSVKSHETSASITDADTATAAREEWWGRLVPQDKVARVEPDAKVAEAEEVPKVSLFGRLTRLLPFGQAEKVAKVEVEKPDKAAKIALQPRPHDDMTGRWRGRWMASGAFGDRRESDAEVVFLQSGTTGTARMHLVDTLAAVGVPEVVRLFGSLGTPVNYRISRGEVVARYEDGPAFVLRFTRVGDRLYGRIDTSPTFVMVLDRI